MKNYPKYLKSKLDSLIHEMGKQPEKFCRNPGRDFTRDRKLPFQRVLSLLVKMGGQALRDEMLDCIKYNEYTASVSAFVQQRNKLLPEALEYLFHRFTNDCVKPQLHNPKYKGYYVGNKVRIVDMFTKKQKFLPPEEWVMFKDETGEIVPAIVSEELWDKANEVLTRRSEDVKSRQGICNHANLLTGKLYCTHCGAAYYRRESKSKDGKVNSKWVCSNKINSGKGACPSFPIYEDEIKPILFEVFSETRVDVEALIKTYPEKVTNNLFPYCLVVNQLVINIFFPKRLLPICLDILHQFPTTENVIHHNERTCRMVCRMDHAVFGNLTALNAEGHVENIAIALSHTCTVFISETRFRFINRNSTFLIVLNDIHPVLTTGYSI